MFTYIFSTKETLKAIGVKRNTFALNKENVFNFNGFVIKSFEVKHNAVDPVNFLIRNKVGEFILFVTDTGTLNFDIGTIKPTYIIIEANFDGDLVEERLKKRAEENYEGDDFESYWLTRNVLEDVGHLSIQKTTKILKKQIDLSLCKQISLSHVSQNRGALDFYKRVEKEVGIKTVQLEPYKIIETNLKKERPF
jgi:phosphoribosyl 1,2-cyclic phosphodiesterase